MREQKEAQAPNRMPGLSLTQGLDQPGQHPCPLCGKIPVYRKVNLGYDQVYNTKGEEIVVRTCACIPHTEEI